MKILLLVLHVLASLGIIAVVLLQSGRAAGLSGAIAGGAEAMFGKRRGPGFYKPIKLPTTLTVLILGAVRVS